VRVRPLKPISKPPRQTPVAVFDVENDASNRTTVVGFQDEAHYRAFPSEADFLAYYCQERYSGYVCYAHNGSGFDFQRLLCPLLEDFEWDFKWLLTGAKLIAGYVSGWDGTWRFADSSLLYRDSLDSLGKAILGEGKRGSYDTADPKELEAYNRQDCEILFSLMQKLLEAGRTLGFEVKPTAAATAFDYLRRQLPATVWLPVSEYFQKAYFGGKVLLIRPEYNGPGFCVDLNSLYSYAMAQELPVGAPRVYHGPYSQAEARSLIATGCGFVRGRVRIAPRPIPPLPFLDKRSHRVLYPVGEFEGLWALPDLWSLTDDDRIWIRDFYDFRPQAFLQDIERKLYAYRQTMVEPHMRSAVKILLNSAYGKFGEKREKTALVSERTGDYYCIEASHAYLLFNKLTEDRQPLARSPAVAAYITALSRRRWHKIFDPIQQNILYLDTDSAYLTGKPEDYPNLPISPRMGDLKIEAYFDSFRGLAPKVYGFSQDDKWHVRAKGFPMGKSFEVNPAMHTVETGKGFSMNYATHGAQFLDALSAHYSIGSRRPMSFAGAGREGVRPGDWVHLSKQFHADPTTARIWTPGMDRTLPPTL